MQVCQADGLHAKQPSYLVTKILHTSSHDISFPKQHRDQFEITKSDPFMSSRVFIFSVCKSPVSNL